MLFAGIEHGLVPSTGHAAHQPARPDAGVSQHLHSLGGRAQASVFLTGRRLTECPEALWQNSSTRRLSLARNSLCSLPPQLCDLSKLESLNVSSNRITALPSGITSLAKLTTLCASHNRIDSVPATLARLTALQVPVASVAKTPRMHARPP
jgi:Leucine-rich repeat (LRR) protein